jgi:hypothetical protein
MAALSEIYIKKETLETLLGVLNKKSGNDAKGIKVTISLNDTGDNYGQNVSAYVSQTTEQRAEKKPRFFIGNGKTFWTKGETPVPIKAEQATTTPQTAAPLPNTEDKFPF